MAARVDFITGAPLNFRTKSLADFPSFLVCPMKGGCASLAVSSIYFNRGLGLIELNRN
jgi:hypothetical protein